MSPVFADEPAALRQPKKRLPIFAGALWAGMFIVFMASPVLQMNDSLYSMLTAESLIQNRSPDLIHYSIPTAEFDRRYRGYPLARTNGRLLYGFAHGSSFLSIPFVALMNELGVSPATRDLKFDFRGELIIQKVQAAFVSASAVAVFFLTAALLLDLQWSTVIAVGAGLGTQVWSTASRGMWQHTWEIMLGSLVVYLLLAAETRRTSVRPIVLATLLSWMFFVRPTGVVPVICTAAYVYGRPRSEFPWFAAAGLGWLTAFIAYSWRIFGTPVPFYYFSFARPLPWDNPVKFQPMTALYGTLISPSRGVFVFCPVIAWVLFVNIQFWRSLKSTALARTALFAGAGIWLVVLSHADWWGGACYGPRYLSDAIPWFVLLAIMGVAAIPPALRTIRSPMILAGAVLLMISIAMNAVGALSGETMAWNFKGRSPDIMLDWSRPQFLAGWLDQR